MTYYRIQESWQENIALGINVYSDENFRIGNIGIGIDSLRRLTTGDRNVAIGYHTLSENQDEVPIYHWL